MTLPISVVIPVYNNRATIVEAVRSAVTQTAEPAEVLVVDDGSSDGSPEAVEQEFGPHVTVIRQANGGPSRARNRGIDAATQPLVAFLDADDVWHPNKLESQYAVLARSDDIGVVASDWVRRPEDWPSLPTEWRAEPLSYQEILVLNRFQTSTVLARTTLVRAVGGFDPKLDGAEDWDLWVRLAARSRVVKIPWPLVVYRDVPTGYSKDVWRVYVTMQGLLDKQRDRAPLSPAALAEIEAWHHLRFAVAFLLLKDVDHARRALAGALAPPLRRHVWRATTRYLLPFLRARLRRRRGRARASTV
ncbi:MAG: glycosyltransferase family 2 protein [Actinomycetia bacterium]|nr:glycosyltransferase family 2 protein [Actinomycetes bacterium]